MNSASPLLILTIHPGGWEQGNYHSRVFELFVGGGSIFNYYKPYKKTYESIIFKTVLQYYLCRVYQVVYGIRGCMYDYIKYFTYRSFITNIQQLSHWVQRRVEVISITIPIY